MTLFARPMLGTADDRRRMADARRVQGIARRRAVLDALRRAGGAMGTADLAASVGIRPDTLREKHLPRLVRAGVVVRERGVVRLVRTAGEGA